MYFKCIVYCSNQLAIYKHKLSRIEFFIMDLTVFEAVIKGVRALRGYFGPPMRSKNKSCSSQVSSY